MADSSSDSDEDHEPLLMLDVEELIDSVVCNPTASKGRVKGKSLKRS